ncbi:MAG: caspase family protein [Bacteroidota bacterium]
MENTPNQKPIELPFAESHAFIIGINNYENISSLSTAVNDAKGIATRLRDQHKFKVHPPLLNATKADIMQWLTNDIPKAVGTEDRVVFYFAGHGIALDGEEGPNGYLVPADADTASVDSLIPMNDFHKMLDDLPCKHGLLILDCCFAGAFKWSTGYRDMVFDMPGVIYEERFWRYVKDPAWQVITSSAYDQKAADVLSNRTLGMREDDGSGLHSPFAQGLFEALEGKGDVIPHGEGDGVITATEMYMYLRDKIENDFKEESKRQTPSLFTLPKHDKGEFIFFHPKHRFNLPAAPDRNPFMGLSSFNEGDAHLFYGRERVVEALREMIKDKQLLVVSGASGTGKSSVIKAGLLPQLRKEGWEILPIIRPGKEPKKNLETELPDAETTFKEKGKVVLVIDQYEELITQTLNDDEGAAFEQQVADWIEAYPDLRVVLSVRSDFEPQFEKTKLSKWWNDGRYIVPAFTLEEIREVIMKPANQEVLFFEPEELVDKLVEEVSQAPGALPLLSFTLSELYEAYLKSGRSDRALLEANYNEMGGVIGALRTKADEAYNILDDDYRSSMRKLMLRMVSIEGGEMAGKRIYIDELKFSDEAETKRIKEVADKLVESRLIMRGKDVQGKVYVEPAHDALVRAWARLWEWIKATGEEKLSLHSKLSLAVNDYHELVESQPVKAKNLLWNNNPRLDLLSAELKEKDHHLNAKEETFVRNSVKLRTTRKRNTWAIAIAVMVGLAILAIYALIQQRIAKEQALTSDLGYYLAESRYQEDRDPTVAFRAAEIGYHLAKNNNRDELSDYRNQLIKTVYNRSRLELTRGGIYQEDKVDVLPSALNNKLEIFGVSNGLYEEGGFAQEYDQNNQLVKRYGQPDDYPNTPDTAYFSPNGLYVIVRSEDDFGEDTEVMFDRSGRKVGVSQESNDLYPYEGSRFLFSNLMDRYITLDLVNELKLVQFNESGEKSESSVEGFGEKTSAITFSPSGNFVAVGSSEGSVKVIIVADGYSTRDFGIRTIYDFASHFNEEILEIKFCDNESVLKTKSHAGAKYWSLRPAYTIAANDFGMHADAGPNSQPQPTTIMDPLFNETVSMNWGDEMGDSKIRYIDQTGDNPTLLLNLEGLYSNDNEVLIYRKLDPALAEDFLAHNYGFSKDGKHAFFNGRLFHLDPELILSLVNEKKIFGNIPTWNEYHNYADPLPEMAANSTSEANTGQPAAEPVEPFEPPTYNFDNAEEGNAIPESEEMPNIPPPPIEETEETEAMPDIPPAPEGLLDENVEAGTATGAAYGLVTQSVSIRSIAGSKDPETVVGSLAAGLRIVILAEDIPEGQVKPWYKVSVNGVEGWVYSNFVEKED